MISALRKLGRLLRLGSLERGDFSSAQERPVENIDALAAAGERDVRGGEFDTGGSGYPPGYVKGYDEGRPKK